MCFTDSWIIAPPRGEFRLNFFKSFSPSPLMYKVWSDYVTSLLRYVLTSCLVTSLSNLLGRHIKKTEPFCSGPVSGSPDLPNVAVIGQNVWEKKWEKIQNGRFPVSRTKTLLVPENEKS